MSSERAAERWSLLRRGGHESSALEIPSLDTGVTTGFGTIRLALGPNGEPRLLIPIRSNEVLDTSASSQCVHIGSQSYSLNGKLTRYLDVICVAGTLEGVFTEVSDEIIQRIEQGLGAQEACNSTIADFRLLLARAPYEVEAQQVSGLIGELLLLQRLLSLNSRSWQLWRGPLSERHDFRGGTEAIEVKATSRVSGWSVRISAIDQLLEPDGGSLALALYQLEATAGGSLSVASEATRAMHMASEPIRVRELLAAMGCTDPEADVWNERRFELAGKHFYRVSGEFPRIVPASFGGLVPAGIEGITYTIDLSAADDFRLAAPEIDVQLREMVACLDH